MKATEEHTEAQENKDIVERIKEVLGSDTIPNTPIRR